MYGAVFQQIEKRRECEAMSERTIRVYVGLNEKAKLFKDYDYLECSPPGALTETVRVEERKIDTEILSELEFYSLDVDSYTSSTNYYGAKIYKDKLMKLLELFEGHDEFCNDVQALDENLEYMIVLSDTYWVLPERFSNLSFID